jgi:hypothetical protein
MILRKFMQRNFARIVAFLLAAACAVGCQGVLPPPDPPPHKNTLLRVACPASLVELLQAQTRPWQGRQEARVEVLPYDLAAGPESVASADVWVIPPAELPRWAAGRKLSAVPDEMQRRGAEFDWFGLLPVYREQLLGWDRAEWGVPLVGEAPVCLVREDLFAAPAWQEKFRAWEEARRQKSHAPACPFRAPGSWQEFATLAEFFAEHHPKGKPGPSLPPLPKEVRALDRLFYQVAASFARRAVRLDEEQKEDHLDLVFSFHYDVRTGTPRIDKPGFVAALELLRRLQACRPASPSPRPEQAFLDGDAVLAVADASWVVEAQKQPDLRDKVGVATLPGSAVYYTPGWENRPLKDGANRVPYLGGAGWLAVVPAAGGKQEAAWSLLADLAGPARSAQVALEPLWGGGPVRESQVLRERWDAFDLDGRRSLALRDAVAFTMRQHGLKNPVVCLRIPDEASHQAVMVAALRRVLLEKADPAAALAGVAKEWSSLDAKRGKDAARVEYRMSLGLSAN